MPPFTVCRVAEECVGNEHLVADRPAPVALAGGTIGADLRAGGMHVNLPGEVARFRIGGSARPHLRAHQYIAAIPTLD